MARTLSSASSNRWLGTNLLRLAEPLTLAGWCRRNGTLNAVGGTLIALDTAAGSSRWQITANSTFNAVALSCNSAGTAASSISSGALADLTWGHIGGVFASPASRQSYLNGVGSAVETTSITVTQPDSIRLGARAFSGAEGIYWNGDLAHLAIWSAALSPTEMQMLYAGVSPLLIRRNALLGYWPLDDQGITANDAVSKRRLDANGVPAFTPFPLNMRRPARATPLFAFGGAAAAAAYTPRLTLMGVG